MEIDLVGRTVEELTLLYSIALDLTGGVEVRIECSFELSEPGHTPQVIVPESLETDRDMRRVLVGYTVERASVDVDSGLLAIAFDDGTTVRVPADPRYEAWTAVWLDGSLLVCLPGGGLAQWGARSRTTLPKRSYVHPRNLIRSFRRPS